MFSRWIFNLLISVREVYIYIYYIYMKRCRRLRHFCGGFRNHFIHDIWRPRLIIALNKINDCDVAAEILSDRKSNKIRMTGCLTDGSNAMRTKTCRLGTAPRCKLCAFFGHKISSSSFCSYICTCAMFT